MRRTLLTLTLALLALALVPAVAGAKPKEPAHDQAYTEGTAQYAGFPTTSIDFNAISDPFGGQADGDFAFTLAVPAGTFEGDVACLRVADNVATIGGVVTESSVGSIPPGAAVQFSVVDQGPSGDTISLILVGTNNCATTLPPAFLVDGNIVVVDSTCENVKEHPKDPAKDKCKDKNKP